LVSAQFKTFVASRWFFECYAQDELIILYKLIINQGCLDCPFHQHSSCVDR